MANPISEELIHAAAAYLGTEPGDEQRLKDVFGTDEVYQEILHSLTRTVIAQSPFLAIDLTGVQAAVVVGMCVGIAAEERKRAGDNLLREMGVE